MNIFSWFKPKQPREFDVLHDSMMTDIWNIQKVEDIQPIMDKLALLTALMETVGDGKKVREFQARIKYQMSVYCV